MKTLILHILALLSSTTALRNLPTPSKTPVGSTKPFENFDPLQLGTDERFDFYREAELKHGRLGMVAASTFPLIESYTHEPAINQFQHLDTLSQIGIVSSMLGVEFYSMVNGWEPPSKPFTLKKGYRPGDFGFNLVKNWESPGATDLQNKELNNGRLAMIAAAGMMAQELINQQTLF